MNVITRNGRPYLETSELETRAGVAIKSLPGQDSLVACFETRCALVGDFIRDGDKILVSATALGEALGARVALDTSAETARLEFTQREPGGDPGAVAQAGMLAPDFRLTTLDGTEIALSDLRGQRVLINSWASW